MKKRSLIAVALGVSVVIAFGGLYASNMGFKLNQLLEAQTAGVSATGQTQLGLPYNPQTSIVTVSDLRDDINATAGTPSTGATPCGPTTTCAVVAVSRFVRSDDSFVTYTGGPADSALIYPIDGTEGQRIQVRQSVNYIVVGSHDPGRVVNLDAQGTNGSATGQTEFSFPYHGTATLASDIRNEINTASAGGNAVVAISKFIKSDDSFLTYTGGPNDTALNFSTAPGDSYRIQVNEDVAYVPSHY